MSLTDGHLSWPTGLLRSRRLQPLGKKEFNKKQVWMGVGVKMWG